MRMTQSILAVGSLLGVAAFAQEVRVFQYQGTPRIGMASGDARFISAEFADGRAIKGAPYSADVSTETVQTLADGNRIAHKVTSSVARDGEGRTRREETLGQPGKPEEAKFIFINDPVAQTSFFLDTRSKEAHVTPMLQMKAMNREGEAKREAETKVVHERVVTRAFNYTGVGGVMATTQMARPGSEKVEELGTRMISGVPAEGRRVTNTIAPGEIGNDRAIEVVRETWYSPDLQITLMSSTSDPRSGTTRYEVTNLLRSEPSPSLFEVPAGSYTIVKEKGNVTVRVEKSVHDNE